MNKEKRRVPKLRFPGFTEDWEQCKLGDLAEIVRGASPRPISDPKWFDNDSNVGWLRIADVTAQDGRIRYLEQKISELGQEKTRVIKTPHLLLSIAATVGKPVINYVPTGVHDGFLIFLNPKFNILYAFWWLEMFREKWNKYGQPGSQVNLNSDLVKNQVINIPNEKEQEKISSFLESLDKIITLHQRKLEHLNLKKKALLQKLFPKNGERYPELRFPGFTDAWEQCKLGSIGSTYTGLSGKTKEDFGHGEAQYITYLNVFQNTISDTTMTDKVEIDTTQNEVKYGDVLFTTSSETPEEVGMSSVWLSDTPNIYLNSFCFGFRPNQKIDPYFLGYSLRAPYMRDKIKILAQGISRYNISKNKVMELEISMPNNEEQKLLGTFLQHIDLIITLHQRKLEHLQLQKKALLQQMFV
ncbi:restriction endonuclease subunit S [Veillonella atypica]|uniref:restriction endonuclease subunit S n=1 Tax=Veillonella atypica TaxID=39777 RepID=UPI00352CA7D1